MSLQSRRWCLTINNWTDNIYNDILRYKDTLKFYIIGKEIGNENNTPHLQIYFESKNPIRFSTLKNKFPTAHIEKAKGNRQQNFEYCSKEGDFITNITIERPREEIINSYTRHFINHDLEDIEFTIEVSKYITSYWSDLLDEMEYNDILKKINYLINKLNNINTCEHCSTSTIINLIHELNKIKEKHF